MPKYKIPAVNGAIDPDIAKLIRDKCVYVEKEKRKVVVNGEEKEIEVEVQKTHVKSWEIHGTYVIIETDTDITELKEYKV